jgi:hypothetical protein
VNGLQHVVPEVAEALKAAFERQWDKEQALTQWEALLRGIGEDRRRRRSSKEAQ